VFLILAQYDDLVAKSVYDHLCDKHGPQSTRFLTADDLAIRTSWTLHQEGSMLRTEMRWSDGQQLSSDTITAVLNRLRFITVPQFVDASEADREYAVMEMHAFLLTWLAGLECSVVNRPNPRSLGGELRGTAEWLLLAARAGLPSRRMRFATSARRFPLSNFEAMVPIDGSGLVGQTTLVPTTKSILGNAPVHFMEPVGLEARRVLIIGEQSYGDNVDASLRNRCLELARASGVTLVEFTFFVEGDKWIFCAANPFPAGLHENEVRKLVELLEVGNARFARA
jgi:hypothetical protein